MHVIDRRRNPQGKSLGNRQRFIRRAREQIRQSLQEKLRSRSVEDVLSGENVVIPPDGIHEPHFTYDRESGEHEHVLPGNREFIEGDRIAKPTGGTGGQGASASDSGDGEDGFVFALSRDEFRDLLFEDRALPDMMRKKLKAVDSTKRYRAGFTTSGPPSRLNMVRSLRRSMVRRAALGRPNHAAIEQIERELAALEAGSIVPADGRDRETRVAELLEVLERYGRRRAVVPWLDPMDLRFNRLESRPEPVAQAVMFCLMDVSASMDEDMKGLAKRFFMLLHLFLERHYEQVEVVFIRHTQRAEEVDEQVFFEGRQTGGTVVSSALQEMLRIVEARYPPDDYNVYVAQASDGDNVSSDVATCVDLLTERILPSVQYMAYVEILPQHRRLGFSTRRESELWQGYAGVSRIHKTLAMRRIAHARDIFPVFRDLFRKEGVSE